MNITLNFMAAVQAVGIYVWTVQKGENPNVDLLECCICTGLFLLRMYVIGVKYAYLPRRNLINIRNEGRSATRATQEQILAWTDKNVSANAILYQLDLALWRSGNSVKEASEHAYFYLNGDVEKHMLQYMNDVLNPNETTSNSNNKSSSDAQSGKSISFVSHRSTRILSSNKLGSSSNNVKVRPLSHVQTLNIDNKKKDNEISFRDILMYVAARATRKHAMPAYVWCIPFVSI